MIFQRYESLKAQWNSHTNGKVTEYMSSDDGDDSRREQNIEEEMRGQYEELDGSFQHEAGVALVQR